MRRIQDQDRREQAIRLGRAYLKEAREMLRHPLASWRALQKEDRELYVERSEANLEAEQEREEPTPHTRPRRAPRKSRAKPKPPRARRSSRPS